MDMNAETIDFKDLKGVQEPVLRQMIREHNERSHYERSIEKEHFPTDKEVHIFPKQPNGVTIVRYVNKHSENKTDTHCYAAVINDTKKLDTTFFSYNLIQAYTLAYLGGNPDLARAVQKLCNLID
ncbi:hypothetical protein CN918_31420 [Priestia megaterium]|nr:hypothetical protein CN918_31420 [Priestia megaterium]